MADQKTIAFSPEGAFGPALNSVGIAQTIETLLGDAAMRAKLAATSACRPTTVRKRPPGYWTSC